MNEKQKEFFRKKLLDWKEKILQEYSIIVETPQESDLVDLASNEIYASIEFKTKDREKKLIKKIDEALRRIDNGTYGYCEETGEPIDLKRLEARPIATLSVEAQERHERNERLYRRNS